ncbi:anion transporter [Campylobacter coli]|nr:anion transporter [Campylobacter coli]ECR2249870.1 anion transporter [Campylobacter coli]
MFITATAPNPLVVDLIAQATNLEVHLTWGLIGFRYVFTWYSGYAFDAFGALFSLSARN